MKYSAICAATLASLAAPAFATDDPITTRQALMNSNAASASVAGAMLKEELPYSPAVGKSVILSMEATALAFGAFFPEGSVDAARSTAAPKIWDDAEAFQAELTKFQAAGIAAAEASGKTGPADLDAFKVAIMPVLGTCKSCHEGYRVEN